MHALVFGLLVVAGPPNPVPMEATWPEWRGPTGDSISPVARLPLHWTRTENVIWKTAVAGWGNSTPAIWQDAIFVTTQQNDEVLLLLRIDRKSGNIVWQREVGRGKPRRGGETGNNRYHDENNMASPSPVTDGRYVWAHFGTGILACYDFAGDLVWSTNMTERFGPYSIWWGHSNSPILLGDMLISVCMQDPLKGGQSYVVAMDKKTGKEIWFTKRMTGATNEPGDAYTTPMLYRHDGRVDLIVLGGQVLDAYDPATGKQLWQCRPFSEKGNRVIPSPTVAGDTIYAVQGMSGPFFAIRAGTAGDGDVTATNVRWKYSGDTNDSASAVVTKGLVFIANNGGFGICLNAETGKQLWKERLGKEFRASPLVAGDKVYFVNKAGKTTIVEASREFRKVAECDLAEDTIPSPAAAGGDLYIRTKGHLYRIGEKKN
jgi:outer membrane protein assembly factor BamB